MPLCTFDDLSICGRRAYPNNAYPPTGKIAYLPRSLITRTRGMIIKDYGVGQYCYNNNNRGVTLLGYPNFSPPFSPQKIINDYPILHHYYYYHYYYHYYYYYYYTTTTTTTTNGISM